MNVVSPKVASEEAAPVEGAAVPLAVGDTVITPMMKQYLEIKAANPDCLLFYRMGDFYELFFQDAEIASRALNIVLTRRGKHNGADIPMCGVPVVRSDEYLHKLIAAGFRVAVCEQIEDPAEARKRGAKSVVQRDVTRLITAGTLTEDSLLDAFGAALLRLRRILDLLAHRDAKARRDQLVQILVRAHHRHAAHRDVGAVVLAAPGQHDVECARRDLGVLEEQLVEIAHPVEQEAIRVGRLDLQILFHHWRDDCIADSERHGGPLDGDSVRRDVRARHIHAARR